MNKKSNNKIIFILAFFLLMITVTSITKIMQNDTFFTIATGNEIIQNGYDNEDHLTWHGNLHFYKLRWAFDVLTATIFNGFGFKGIYIFVLIVGSTIILSLYYILLRRKNSVVLSFIGALISSILITGIWGFTARGQIISYLLLLWEVFCLEQLIETNKKIYYVFLGLISVLIVNFHASVWIMSEILVLPYLAEAILSRFINKTERITIEKIKIKQIIMVIFILFIGSFLSPIGSYTYTYMFKTIGGLSSSFIAELQSSEITQTLGLAILITIYAILTLSTKTKIKLRDLLLFLGLFIMAILAKRNLAFLYLIGIIPIINLIQEFFNTYDKDDLLNKFQTFLSKKKIIIILTAIVFITITPNIIARAKESYIDKTKYPVEAVKYIKDNLKYEDMKIYNHFDFGSYLEFCNIKAFVDSRSEIFCKEFNDVEILQDWFDVCKCRVHYDDIFKKYNIDYVLVYNKEGINTYLNKDSSYDKIYEDEYFSIYNVKK